MPEPDDATPLPSTKRPLLFSSLCRFCGHRWRALLPWGSDGSYLECPNCRRHGGQSDGSSEWEAPC